MAWVQAITLLRFYFRDNDNTTTYCEAKYAASVDLDSLLSLLPSWTSIIAPLTNAVCVERTMTAQYKETATPAPAIGSNVKSSAVFYFSNAAGEISTARIPSIKPAYIESSGPYAGIALVTGDPTIGAFTDMLIFGDRVVNPCDQHGNDLETYLSGMVEIF